MNSKTLTVIVPCYNVKGYLRKCVESIANQTYKDISILLIDDGSTDGTSSLCDEIASSDKRIKVIHQENKGSSLTREIGINNSNSEFVTFVDSDDWIHPDMYQHMMDALINENADIAQCGVCDMWGDTPKHRYQDIYNNIYTTYNHIDSFCKLIEEKEWRSYFWNKIYRRQLFENVQFPAGRGLDEDTSVMHQVFHHAKSTVYFKDEYYFYFHRQGSICMDNSLEGKFKKYYDRTNARLERYLFVAQYPEYKSIMPYLKSITISMCIAGLRLAAKYPTYFPKNYFNYLSSNILAIPFSKSEMDPEWISKMKKIELRYLRLSPALYRHTIPLIYKLLK